MSAHVNHHRTKNKPLDDLKAKKPKSLKGKPKRINQSELMHHIRVDDLDELDDLDTDTRSV